MDRTTIYPGSIPQDTDLLATNKNAMIAFGSMAAAAFGTSVWCDGLACTQTSTPSLAVTVAPGSLAILTTVDNTAYGSIPADTTDPLVKVGYNPSATLLPITNTTTTGQSVVYLIEAAFSESDVNPTVLPYYNAATPTQPYLGPNNTGSAQNTARTQRVTLVAKAGTPATTGSQVTPSPDAGYVGLYTVTIAYGAVSVLNANITQLTTAPFLTAKLGNIALSGTPVNDSSLKIVTTEYLQSVVAGYLGRVRLTGNLNLYVATTGSDSNSGLTVGAPFLTLNAAWAYIVQQLDLNGYQVTVNVAAGTYTGGLNAAGVVTGNTSGTGGVIFLGNASSPSTVTISTTTNCPVTVSNGATISVQGFTLTATGASAMQAGADGFFNFSNIIFGTCGGANSAHLFINGVGSAVASGPYTISGGATCHALVTSAGVLGVGVAVTLSGSPVFSTAFCQASTCGVAQWGNSTFSGSAGATTPRYSATLNGVIFTLGGGATFLPGTSAGSVATGGQYA